MKLIHRIVVAPVAIAIVAASLSVAPAASATGPLSLEATFTSPAEGWDKFERWRDANPGFVTAQYPSDGRIDQTGQRQTFFGTARPDAGQFLLSYAPGWATNP